MKWNVFLLKSGASKLNTVKADRPSNRTLPLGTNISPKIKYYDMSDQTSAEANQYHFLGKHIIALQGAYEVPSSDGKPYEVKTFLYSGFVMSLGGFWVFVTAGHNLRALE